MVVTINPQSPDTYFMEVCKSEVAGHWWAVGAGFLAGGFICCSDIGAQGSMERPAEHIHAF